MDSHTGQKGPGRPKLPPEAKALYERQPVSLRPDQWEALRDLVTELDVPSRSGPNWGKPSWRTMMALMAENKEAIIQAIKYMRRLAAAFHLLEEDEETKEQKPSWKELLRLLVAQLPHIVEIVEHQAQEKSKKRKSRTIKVTPQLSLLISPAESDPELEAIQEEIKQDIAKHKTVIVREGDMPV